MIPEFCLARIPSLVFGVGSVKNLPGIILSHGKTAGIVTGEHSLKKSGKWDEISARLDDKGIQFFHVSVSGEPTPGIVDRHAETFRGQHVEVVVGIGGGSVTDAGKAISAMIPKEDSVKNYLEGVGTKTHDGEKVPYVAVPTTSGTGSEATKNAVIRKVGPEGFKKSLRHDNLVPDHALIDPDLMISCPPSVTAACGMDAFTQLLESYVSTKASPMTDALAWSGMKHANDNVIAACGEGSSDVEVRTAMAYASLMSGITLANAGLGIVHGLASPIGGFFDIPHGVVCGTLLAEATKMNVEKLRESGAAGKEGLEKHARIGALLTGQEFRKAKILELCDSLVKILREWTESLDMERLGKYGITDSDVEKIVGNAGLKNNPVRLSEEEIAQIVRNRL